MEVMAHYTRQFYIKQFVDKDCNATFHRMLSNEHEILDQRSQQYHPFIKTKSVFPSITSVTLLTMDWHE